MFIKSSVGSRHPFCLLFPMSCSGQFLLFLRYGETNPNFEDIFAFCHYRQQLCARALIFKIVSAAGDFKTTNRGAVNCQEGQLAKHEITGRYLVFQWCMLPTL